MKNIYLIIFLFSTQFLCATSSPQLEAQDMRKFREFIQEGKGFHKFPEGPISKAEFYKITQEKAPWDKKPIDFLQYFDELVKTEIHADEMRSWATSLPEGEYVLSLEAFAHIYAKTALHDRFLTGILHTEGSKDDFLEINYRNKHIQKFCKLLVEKMDVDNPLLKEVKSILSGKDLAMLTHANLKSLIDSFNCRILSRDDWAEEFKQWGPPYEDQAVHIQKCIAQFKDIRRIAKGPDPAVVIQQIIPALKEAGKQLKVFKSYKQTESKEDWQKLILLFKELEKNMLEESDLSEEQKAKVLAYIDAHPEKKEAYRKVVVEIMDFPEEANEYQEGILVLATEKAYAEIDAKIDAEIEALLASPPDSSSPPSQ